MLCSFRMETESVKCQRGSLYAPDKVGLFLDAREELHAQLVKLVILTEDLFSDLEKKKKTF